MDIDPNNPRKEDRDYLIVSKGHAAIGIYAVLAFMGYFTFEELNHLGEYNSIFGGHPDYNKVPGIEASTGSLGHGFPMAVGIALGQKIKRKKQIVYCILGDGEANEGSVWEAVHLAGQMQLNNLICIFDYNKSIDKYLKWNDIEKLFQAYNWETKRVDGHNHDELQDALEGDHIKPLAVIADTVKGSGCEEMEKDPPAWHHRAITEEEYKRFIKELE